MPTIVTMPKWGLTMTTGTVTNWLAAEGAPVTAGTPIVTVETEKAVNDVEAPADGVLARIVAPTGSEVPVSGPIAVIAAADEAISDADIAALLSAAGPVAATSHAGAGARPARSARPAARDATGRVNASPAARKRAAELGVDLATVEATGPGGRITSDDIERAAAATAAAGEAPREDVVTLADGREIAALLAGPEDAPEKLVFLHGLTGAQSTWMSLLGSLVERYRVAALDLPGHGKSSKTAPEAADYSVSGLAAAADEAMRSLGMAPAIVVGHSLGGAVALQLALSQPKAVRALVLIDSAGLGKEIAPELLDLVAAEPTADSARSLFSLFLHDQRLVLERGVEEMRQNLSAEGAHAAVNAIANAAFSREGQTTGLEARLGDVDRPTYIVWGELDRVIPAAQAGAAQERIRGSWLDVMEGIGHVPQVEAPIQLAALLDAFIAYLPPAPAPEAPAPAVDIAEAPASGEAPVAAEGETASEETSPNGAAPDAAAPAEAAASEPIDETSADARQADATAESAGA
jgi:pyruvate dehydrogenase E2 component (dihydrolipoyllysine-residue acetyltransferase)